jgi:hypothetical protein
VVFCLVPTRAEERPRLVRKARKPAEAGRSNGPPCRVAALPGAPRATVAVGGEGSDVVARSRAGLGKRSPIQVRLVVPSSREGIASSTPANVTQ